MHAIFDFIFREWIFIVVFLGFATFLYIKWRDRAKMKKFAGEMGFSYSTGAESLFRMLRKVPAEQSLPPSPLMDLLGLFSSWKIEGNIQGVRVAAFEFTERTTASDETRRKCLLIRASFDPQLSLGLFVGRRGKPSRFGVVAQKIADKLRPNSDGPSEVITSNETLNQQVLIQAKSQDRARNIFSDAAIQEQVLRTMELGGAVTIDDSGVKMETGLSFKDPEKLRPIFELLASTAARLQTLA